MVKDAIIVDLHSKIQRLEEENKLLLAEVTSLQLQLKSYQTRKTSHNSSKPPSHDFDKAIRNKSLRGKSNLPSGGQRGHIGKTLERNSNPDKLVIKAPSHCCGCGKSLQGQEPMATSSYQVVDIPSALVRSQYFGHRLWC